MQFEVDWENESRDVNAVAHEKILSFDEETGAGNIVRLILPRRLDKKKQLNRHK